jgi:hypothetical protein
MECPMLPPKPGRQTPATTAKHVAPQGAMSPEFSSRWFPTHPPRPFRATEFVLLERSPPKKRYRRGRRAIFFRLYLGSNVKKLGVLV